MKKLCSRRAPNRDPIDVVDLDNYPDTIGEIIRIFSEIYPGRIRLCDLIARHGEFIGRLFTGQHPDYRPCDTLYHDLQHTMEVSLCMTRMLYGYEALADPSTKLGAKLFAMGILSALYHDSGYLLNRKKDNDILCGSAITGSHVGRGALLMREKLANEMAVGDLAEDVAKVIHFTGMEVDNRYLRFSHPAFRRMGKLLGSADLIAQCSDRCYLEKCRDRLFPELVVGRIKNLENFGQDYYESPMHLLSETLEFYTAHLRPRLESSFNSYYHYVGVIFGGVNHYVWSMENNMRHLKILVESFKLDKLNRRAPDTAGWRYFPFDEVDRILASRS